MISVDYLFVCQAIREEMVPATTSEASGQRQLAVLAPLHLLNPQSTPTEYSFGIVGQITGFDPEVPHTLSVGLFDPPGGELFRTPASSVRTPDHLSYPREDAAVLIALQMQNVRLASEGDYILRIYLDGDDVGSRVIKVRERRHG